MKITVDMLKAICPRCKDPGGVVLAMEDTLQVYKIATPKRNAAFIAQIAHESNEFNILEENLNYSAERLVQVWPRIFLNEPASPYARNPEKLANRVYANRMGNGSPESGDGWRFRGRGWIQLTGRDNYEAAANKLGLAIVDHPEMLSTPEYAAEVACWFWSTHKCNEFADADEFEKITRTINGGLTGLAARRAYWERAKLVLSSAS